MLTVTILISVYNKVETVEKCIKSLLAVDHPDKKIFVIDGYSTDGSFEILQRYKEKIELYQVEGNYSKALNWALDRISTEYVALTDADCVVDKNWLKELMKPFKEEDVIATAGYCGTPEDSSLLQVMIGFELENRFKRFPRYITRAPTMNLCVKTEIAKKVKFDEHQQVAVETDFGYRLTALGKMRYNPKAKIVHYHRTTWKSYFKQQKDQVKWSCRILLKHRGKALGDHISTRLMIIQIPLFACGFGMLLLSLVKRVFLIPSALFFLCLLIIYLKNITEFIPLSKQYFPFIGIFAFRTFAWVVGVTEAAFYFSKDWLQKYIINRGKYERP